jgi:multidrug efflux system outer membrane protein
MRCADRMRLAPRSRLVLAVIATLTGCAVGPDYVTPLPTLDDVFVGAGSRAVDSRLTDIATFWRAFDDPVLTSLVERAIAANGDIRIAQARLQEARASLSGTRATLLPEVDIATGAARSLAPESRFPGTTRDERTANTFDAGFIANWELDFFGRNRRATESSAALVQASQAGVHAAQTAVAAEVARNYLDLRGLQQRYSVAELSLANQRDTLQLVVRRLELGRGTQLDVARARSLLENTEAALPALQADIERDAYRLATLTAQPPRQLLERMATPQALPALPVTDLASLPIGTPADLLRRRADLVVAERRLAAATADIGVATADLFPRISLTGLIGFETDRAGRIGSRDSEQYNLGAALTWPVLDFGRVRARIRINEARASEALANYEQTVAVALEETEGALSQFTRSAQQAQRLANASKSADEATRLSRLRFDAGAVDLSVVLDAQRQALESHDALTRAELAQAAALVTVYRSLGGGWPMPGSPR